MGITVTQAASATSITSNTSLSITGVTAAVGDWLVVAVVADNAGTGGAATLTGVSDGSNTYTERTFINNDPGTANAGLTLGIYTAPITSALSGATLTVSFSGNTECKVAQVFKLTPGSGQTLTLTQSGTAQMSESATTWSSSIPTMQTDDLVICVLAIEREGVIFGGDNDTTRGTWAEWKVEAGGGLSGQVCYSQRKIVTGDGTQSWQQYQALGTASDICWNFHCFRAESSAAPLPRFQQHFRQRVL